VGEKDSVVGTEKTTNKMFSHGCTGGEMYEMGGMRGDKSHVATVDKSTNTTAKVLPSQKTGKTESPDSSGEPPEGAPDSPPEPDAADQPPGGVLDDGPAEPLPESTRKIERAARAATAAVAARAAAAEAARAADEVKSIAKKRKPK
jgi:hypothetical protein